MVAAYNLPFSLSLSYLIRGPGWGQHGGGGAATCSLQARPRQCGRANVIHSFKREAGLMIDYQRQLATLAVSLKKRRPYLRHLKLSPTAATTWTEHAVRVLKVADGPSSERPRQNFLIAATSNNVANLPHNKQSRDARIVSLWPNPSDMHLVKL